MAVNEAPRLQYDREYEEAIMARPRPLEYSVDEWQTMAEGESKRYLELLKKMRFGDLMMTLIYLDYPEKDVLRAFADPNGSFFYELNGEVDDSSFYNTDHVYHPIRIRRIQNVVQVSLMFRQLYRLISVVMHRFRAEVSRVRCTLQSQILCSRYDVRDV